MAKRGAKPGLTDTFTGDVDLSSYQYCVVVRGASRDTCKLPTAAGAGRILGVVWGLPASGADKTISVIRNGLAKLILCGTVAAGDELEIGNTSGAAQQYTQDGSNGRIGVAEESGVTGDIITAYIEPIDFAQLLT